MYNQDRMGVFSKSFFNFPPSDPEEPGPAQDGNRSLRESHSTGKEISELLSHYDEETITSLDGKKYNVMAQREGSDVTEAWWAPTPDVKGNTLKIAQGAIMAPWDNTSSGTDDYDKILPKDSYRNFYEPDPDPGKRGNTLSLKDGDNYYYVKATFQKKELSFSSTQEVSDHDHGGSGSGSAGGTTITLGLLITAYYMSGNGNFEIIRREKDTEIEEQDSDLVIHQYLGHYIIEEGKIKESRWRTGDVLDFRRPIITTGNLGGSGSPSGPSDPNA